MEWVRKWLDLRERLIEIAKTLRRFPWIVDVVRQANEHLTPVHGGGLRGKGRV